MTTTVGLFHADFSQPAAGFRAGLTTLATYPNIVPVVLPALVGTRAAVAALTRPQCYDSLLKALLAQGWQDLNFLFEKGAWFELTDMLGTRGRQLAPAGVEPETEGVPEPEMITEAQERTLYNVTKSHVFDHDREALRNAAEVATVDQATELLGYVLREVKTRKETEKLQLQTQTQGRR